MENTIYELTHNEKKSVRSGIVVATVMTDDPSKVSIGWSAVNVNAGDRFNKDMGMRIALNRANTGSKVVPCAPEIASAVERMKLRAPVYFKDKQIVLHTTRVK